MSGALVRAQERQMKRSVETSSDHALIRATALQARGSHDQSLRFWLTNRLPDMTASTASKRSQSTAVFKT